MRLNEQHTVVVENLVDIQQAILEFLPNNKEKTPEVSVKLVSEGKTYDLKAPAGCTYRELIINGFNIVKRRLGAISKGHNTELGIEPVSVGGHMWLDDLIVRRLGGTRDGLRVKWSIKDGIFYFDPYTGKLTKSEQ